MGDSATSRPAAGAGIYCAQCSQRVPCSVFFYGLSRMPLVNALTIAFTVPLTVYVVTGPLLISALLLPGHYTMPSTSDWFLFVLAGLCSALAWVGHRRWRSAGPSGTACAIRVYGADRRCGSGLLDLGRGTRPMGDCRRSDHHQQRAVHCLS